jgi:hypothetical protein
MVAHGLAWIGDSSGCEAREEKRDGNAGHGAKATPGASRAT